MGVADDAPGGFPDAAGLPGLEGALLGLFGASAIASSVPVAVLVSGEAVATLGKFDGDIGTSLASLAAVAPRVAGSLEAGGVIVPGC